MATTAWNTSFAPGCSTGSCMGVSPSGALPLVLDTVDNANDFVANTGATPGTTGAFNNVFGVGGNPMADGPFTGFNANFDITSMSSIVVTPAAVPVPAAVWLFGSGLVGLVGVARRRKA